MGDNSDNLEATSINSIDTSNKNEDPEVNFKRVTDVHGEGEQEDKDLKGVEVTSADPPSDKKNSGDSNDDVKSEGHEMTLAEMYAKDEQSMYLKSQAQQQAIDEEIRVTQPLAGPKLDISTLTESYDMDHSPQFYLKATDIASRYSHIRRIRGDGNCFYRAMMTAVLEICTLDKAELERITEISKNWRPKLLKFGFPALTTIDFCDAFDSVLSAIADGSKPLAFLLDDLNNDSIANYYVAYTRLITSGWLRENEATYSGFIEGSRTMEQYCQAEIDPMWVEVDHLGIIALVNAFQTPIRIEYMDNSHAPNGGWSHDVQVENSENQQTKIFFLYRPGHYDLLYKN